MKSSGIGQLMAMLTEHLDRMQEKDASVEKIIANAGKTAGSLRNAKKKALENEKALLLSIMEDIDGAFLSGYIFCPTIFLSNMHMDQR